MRRFKPLILRAIYDPVPVAVWIHQLVISLLFLAVVVLGAILLFLEFWRIAAPFLANQ
jgi:hypothetical protein